jgi:cobalamin biosynthesis protein CobT
LFLNLVNLLQLPHTDDISHRVGNDKNEASHDSNSDDSSGSESDNSSVKQKNKTDKEKEKEEKKSKKTSKHKKEKKEKKEKDKEKDKDKKKKHKKESKEKVTATTAYFLSNLLRKSLHHYIIYVYAHKHVCTQNTHIENFVHSEEAISEGG